MGLLEMLLLGIEAFMSKCIEMSWLKLYTSKNMSFLQYCFIILSKISYLGHSADKFNL